ncbi:hypothetical protein ScPMuIL_017125 [Solemya velum]
MNIIWTVNENEKPDLDALDQTGFGGMQIRRFIKFRLLLLQGGGGESLVSSASCQMFFLTLPMTGMESDSESQMSDSFGIFLTGLASEVHSPTQPTLRKSSSSLELTPTTRESASTSASFHPPVVCTDSSMLLLQPQASSFSSLGTSGDTTSAYISSSPSTTMSAEIGIFPTSSFTMSLPDYGSESVFSSDDLTSGSYHGSYDLPAYQSTSHGQSQTFPETYSYEGTFMLEKDIGKQLGIFTETAPSPVVEQTPVTSASQLPSTSQQTKFADSSLMYEEGFQGFSGSDLGFYSQRFGETSPKTPFTTKQSPYTQTETIYQQSAVGYTDLDSKQSAFHHGFQEGSGLYPRDTTGYHGYHSGAFYEGQSLPVTDTTYSMTQRGSSSLYRGDMNIHTQTQPYSRRPSLTIAMPSPSPEGMDIQKYQIQSPNNPTYAQFNAFFPPAETLHRKRVCCVRFVATTLRANITAFGPARVVRDFSREQFKRVLNMCV